MILEELEKIPDVSISYIQRKYQRSYAGAKKLQHGWVKNEPIEPIFEEKLQKFEENKQKFHDTRQSIIKKRFTAFMINGKFFDSWKEAEEELNK